MNRVLAAALIAALPLSASCTKPPVIVPDAGEDAPSGVDAHVPLDAGRPDDGVSLDTCRLEGGRVPLGGACLEDADCDDACYCNGLERCSGGACVAGDDPCAFLAMQPCASTSCFEELNRCFVQPHDERCADGDFCNGRETCDPRLGCLPSEIEACNDGSTCTFDSCDPRVGCVYTPRDLDGDGYRDGHCGGDDCNDLPPDGAAIHPGATEVCDDGRDNDCDGVKDFDTPTCIPTNDVCATARALPGPGTYSAATRMLTANYTLSCGTASQADAVFTFDVAETSDVRVAFAGAGGGSVALRRAADCALGPDLRCNAATTSPAVFARGLEPGSYAAIVKTAMPAAFSLTLTIHPPEPVPIGEDCGHPVVVTPDGPAASADLATLGIDYGPSCATPATGARDGVFAFDTLAPLDVTVNVTTPTTFGDIVTFDQLPCGTTAGELRCRSLTRNADTEFFRSLPAGTHFVVVWSRTGGTATVAVTTAPPTAVPPNDLCSGATPLVPATGTFPTQTLIGFSPDGPSESCLLAGGATPDAFYTFHVAGPRLGAITAFFREPPGGTVPAALVLRAACGGAEVSGTCVSAATVSGTRSATLYASGLAPGDYILQVAEDTRSFPPTDFMLQWIIDTGVP